MSTDKSISQDTSSKKAAKRNKKGQLLPGQPSLNPSGRPPGSLSIIGRIKQIWLDNPEQFEKWVLEAMEDNSLRRELIQQIDGKPVQPIAGVEDKPIVIHVTKYGDSLPPVQPT